MAIFKKQEELQAQAQPIAYKGTTGWRKTAMNVMNSKYNPYSYTGTVAKQFGNEVLAQGDDKKVYRDQRADSIAHQGDALKAAFNFMPGAGGKMAGTMTDKIQGLVDKKKADGEASELGDAVEASENAASMESATDDLNRSVDDIDVNSLEGLGDGSDYSTETDFLSKTDGPVGATDVGDAEAIGGVGGAAKGMKGAAGGMDIFKTIGDVAKVIQNKSQYDKNIASDKKSMMKRREYQNNVYDLY